MSRMLIVVALLSLMPIAEAALYLERSDEEIAAPSAPSGEYQDAYTLVIYRYYAATDTLVPIGVGASADGFYGIDVVSPGQKPATGHGTCGASAFCVGARALAANPEQETRSLSVGVDTSCSEPWRGAMASFAGQAYPYDRYPWFGSGCADPTVTATLYLDDQAMAVDQWP